MLSNIFGSFGNVLGNLFDVGQTGAVTQGAQKGVEEIKDFTGRQQAEMANEQTQKAVANSASMMAAEIMGTKAVANMKFMKDMNDMENGILGQCGSSFKQLGQG